MGSGVVEVWDDKMGCAGELWNRHFDISLLAIYLE